MILDCSFIWWFFDKYAYTLTIFVAIIKWYFITNVTGGFVVMRPAFEEEQLRPRHHYVTGIDGLRTIAVIGVIIYHLLPNVMVGGFLGVPLFLIVSGYFITGQLLQAWRNDIVDLKSLYARRFTRLYPVLITMLVFTTAYITLFARQLLHQIRAVIITNLLWVYNWWEIGHGQSYFDRFGGESPFTHLWTLGVEAQFYLLWPLILLLLLRVFGRRITQWLVLLLAILSAVEMAMLFDPQNINRVYYGTDTRAFSLLLGSWLAFAWPQHRLNPDTNATVRTSLNAVGIVALIITIFSFFNVNGQNPRTYHGWMFFYSVIGMILVATIVHPGSDMNTWLTNPVFTWVGKRSYGIYVYQLPVMIFYEKQIPVGAHPWLNGLIELALILGVSELSYRFVEKSLRHYSWQDLPITVVEWFDIRHRGWKQWLAIIPASLVFLTALAGFTTPDRVPQKTAVQRRIEHNHNSVNAHNKMLAEGKAPQVSTNSKSLKKKFDLSGSQVAAAKKLHVTAVGDSVMVDASKNLQELVPNAYVDAKVGRQGSEAVPVIKDLKDKGHLSKIVVLNLGTNGPMTNKTVNEIISTIGSGHQIFWITPHVPSKSWEATVTHQIKHAAKKHSNVHVVDWNSQSADHSEWFADDNVHMNEKGNAQFTRLIVKTILAKE